MDGARCAPLAPIESENTAGADNVHMIVRMKYDPRPWNTPRLLHATNISHSSHLCYPDNPVGASRYRVRA